MIEQSDFDAIERTIREWHERRLSESGLTAEQQGTLAEEQLLHVAYTRMWAQRAGVIAEQTQAEDTQTIEEV